MRRYCIKNHADTVEYIDILREIDDGYIIRLTRQKEGNEKISEETITNQLLDICLKTGYLYETTVESVA